MERTKPVFCPILDNGSNNVKANYMYCFATAFAGRAVHLSRASDSLASRGMNKISADFLASDCDQMLLIDCDIIFTAAHVEAILSHDAPLVYGVYPKRDDNLTPCLATLPGHVQDPNAATIHVRRAGRGFMRVSRALLEAMKEENGGFARRYVNHGRDEWHFWETGVVTGEMSSYEDGSPEFLSEDWYFCERARAMGVPILVDQRIVLSHEGDKIFSFKQEQLHRIEAEVKRWQDIPGWFTEEDAQVYLAIAQEVPARGRIVEVGAWLGRSLGALILYCRWFQKAPEVFAVDTFRGSPDDEAQAQMIKQLGNVRRALEKNMMALGVNGEVKIIEEDSREAVKAFADGELDAVFIDGDHAYTSVLSDVSSWIHKVKSGGIIAGHDYDYPSVASAVHGVIAAGAIQKVGRCWYYKKPVDYAHA